MLAARPWLPANALSDGALAALCVESANAWAARWLVDPRTLTATRTTITNPTKLLSSAVSVAAADHGVVVSTDQVNAIRLAASVLNLPASLKPNDTDIRLFRRLARTCVRDLGRALIRDLRLDVQALGDNHPDQIEDAEKFSLAFASGGPCVDIYLNRALAISARRIAAKGYRTGPRFGNRAAAADRQSVRVGAFLGEARVGLPDLYALACGDVLVLDRGCEDALPLTVNDRPLDQATCTVRQSPSAYELCMTRIEGVG